MMKTEIKKKTLDETVTTIYETFMTFNNEICLNGT